MLKYYALPLLPSWHGVCKGVSIKGLFIRIARRFMQRNLLIINPCVVYTSGKAALIVTSPQITAVSLRIVQPCTDGNNSRRGILCHRCVA